MGAGTAGGAGLGAIIGTIISPGIGTAIVASIGASAGGMYDQKKAQDQAEKDMKAISNRPVPVVTPPPTPTDQNPGETAAQRQKKLSALRYGMASTITSKPELGAAPLSTPSAQPLKTKLGA